MLRSAIDFLGIGVQKGGTTWLWKNLQQHPSIWMPPIKELHYFDRSPIYPSPSHLSSKYFVKRFFGRKGYNKIFRERFLIHLNRAIKKKDWSEIHWVLHFYLGTYDDNWYASLFKNGENKVRGEITPAYSMLNLEDVEHIRDIFPELKIILLLRNPIDRAWSHIRYNWRLKSFDSEDIDKIKSYINSPNQSLRSDYVSIIKKWSLCFPKEQIFIGFYDDIIKNPQELMSNIFEFLGVEASKFHDHNLNKKFTVSKEKEIPKEIRLILSNKYYSDLKKLSDDIGRYSIIWLKETEKTLEVAEQDALTDIKLL